METTITTDRMAATPQRSTDNRMDVRRTRNGRQASDEVSKPITTIRGADVRSGTREDAGRPRSALASRCVNIVLAIVGLVLASPILLIVALAIKLTSPGPICYRQIRVGIDRRRRREDPATTIYDRRTCDLGGQVFRIYKFRSMRVNAERLSGAVWATADDPRVTPIGRIMRKTRIDELPQLFNVLCGDMNIVGPRPERPSFFGRLRDVIPEYPLRQRARPGITGWAQVNHRYDASVDDVRRKVELDLEYLQQQGIANDLRILVRTIPVVLFGRGAC